MAGSQPKTLVVACQNNSITSQILQIISKKQRKRKEEICVVKSKAKTNLFKASCEKPEAKNIGLIDHDR